MQSLVNSCPQKQISAGQPALNQTSARRLHLYQACRENAVVHKTGPDVSRELQSDNQKDFAWRVNRMLVFSQADDPLGRACGRRGWLPNSACLTV